MDERMLTIKEAAALGELSPDWLKHEARRIKAVWYRRLGHRTVRIEPQGFLAYLRGKRSR